MTEILFRCDFTPSEKVEIARKIEEAMAGRVGNPNLQSCNTLQNCEKGNSRDIAAAAVGKELKIEKGRILIFAKSKSGKKLAKNYLIIKQAGKGLPHFCK